MPLLAQNALPISESFSNATAPNIEFGGSPGAILTAAGGTPIDVPGSGFLRLTTNGGFQTGFARSTGSFSSTNGVSVQFEYFTYGGSGADGITFFLYDASASPFAIGAFGGSLGYAQRNDPLAGVSKGFIAIGLDEFGNFSNPTEGRQGGVTGSGFGGAAPSSVTLRGSGDGSAEVATNYEYLTSIQTSDQTAMTNAGAGVAFQIAGGVDGRTGGGLTSADIGYRRVKMDLMPNGLGTGFNISVAITENSLGTAVLHTVVNNYSYIPDDGIPATLSYGFAASTGGSNNFHEIRNIDIVAAVALAPTAVADAATTPEDTPVTFNIVTNDSDQNGNSTLNSANGVDLIPGGGIDLSRTVTGEGTYTYNGNGTVTFVPVANFNGTSTISYTINDGALPSSAVNIVVTVTAVNDAPVAVADVAATAEDTPVTFSVTGNDTDVDGTIDVTSVDLDPVTAGVQTTFTVSGQGTYTASNTGTVTFTPVLNYNGTATPVNYVVKDNSGSLSNSTTITVTVTAVNDVPVAVADVATTAEDTPVTFSVTGNDTDVDGTIDVTSVDLDPVTTGVQTTFTVSGQGTYTASNTGTVTFTPVLNYNGTATPVNYVVKDNSGSLSNSTTITVTVTAVNDVPVAVADVATTAEDTPVTFSVTGNDTDVDGTIDVTSVDLDPVTTGVQTTFTVSGQGTYTASNTGTVTFTPVLNYNGTATPVNYVVKDNSGSLSNSTTITVTVTAVNDAPTFTLAANQTVTACGVAQTVTSFATNISPGPADENAQTVAFTLTNNNNSLFSTQPAISTGGNLTYTPAATANGLATITVVLTDSGGASTTQTFTITVNGAAQPSTISGSNSVCIGASNITYSVTLEPGHTYAWTYSNPADVTFTANPEGNSITVNYSNTAVSGTWSVTATATGGCPSAARTLPVTVTSTPQPGTITGTASICAGSTGTSYSVPAVANTTYNWTYSGTGATIASGGGTNSITVNYASNATVGTWTVIATGPNTCPSLPQTFAVTAVNVTPTVAAITGASTVNVGATIALASTTTGGTWSSSNTSVATVSSTGIVTGVSVGTATISYTLSSGGCSGIATKVITINAGNTPPVAVADSYTVVQSGTLTVPVNTGVLSNDTDANGNTLTAIKVLSPNYGTLTFNSDGSFVYVHSGGTQTSDSFTYKVNDGTVDGNTVTVSIAITATNNPPIAQNDIYTVTYNGSTTISAPGVLSNDTDLNSDPLTAIRVSDPAHGTLTLNSNGSFIYVNNGGSATSDSFTYKVNDGKVDGNTVTVTLNIVRPNQAPLAVADTYNTSKGSTLTVSVPGVLGNDSDADGNSITAIKVSNPSHGTLVFNSNGSFTYAHDNGSAISDSFEYKVSDGTIDGNTVTVTISIVAPGALPIISDVNLIVHKNEQYSFTAINFTEKFVDLQQHDLLKIKIVTLPTSGTLRLDGVNVSAGQEILAANLTKLSFTPASNFIGLVSFLYNASCSVGYALANKNVNMTVVDPGVPPVAVADTYTLSSGNTLTVASPGVLANDIDAGNHTLTAIKVTDPAHGSLTLNANGSFSYTYNSGTTTSDTFSYRVNNGYQNSNIVNVTITIPFVNIPPVVSNITKSSTGFLPMQFTVSDFTSKFTDTNPLVKVRIQSLPSNGVLKLNGIPVTVNQEIPVADLAMLTFEPSLNWSGTTNFTWNGSDGDIYATNPANAALTVITPTDPNAKIGLAKNLASATPVLNGTYDVKFVFTAVNFGPNGLENISIKDNLALAFGGSDVIIKTITAFGNLRANTLFNGSTDTELLLPASRLLAGEEAKVELLINVRLVLTSGIFQNTATAEASSSVNGFKVRDVSTNGLRPDPNTAADVSPAETTPIKLDPLPAYVPAGFSPNGDGTNDKFVVQNANGKQVSLEMYNRWGNRVYKSEDYKNDWGGEVTEGFFLGRDIPDGTYYYIIIIDKKDKYTGFITVNR